jgi:hypothetical protein
MLVMSGPGGHSAGSQWSHRWRSEAKTDAAQGCFGDDADVSGIPLVDGDYIEVAQHPSPQRRLGPIASGGLPIHTS